MKGLIISPNEVFGDIMVFASHPPVDLNDINALTGKIFNGRYNYEGRYPPEVRCY